MDNADYEQYTEKAVTLSNELAKFAYNWCKGEGISEIVAAVAIELLRNRTRDVIPPSKYAEVELLAAMIGLRTEQVPREEATAYLNAQGASLEDIYNVK